MRRTTFFVLVLITAGSCLLGSFLGTKRALFVSAEEPSKKPATEAMWRTQEHDGVNCLYLMLHVFGRPAKYADLTKALGISEHGNTLKELRDAGQRFGLRLEVYKCNPDDLVHTEKPVIAHTDGLRETNGGFVLILSANEKEVYLIDGASATIARVSMDDFRRGWTGYILVPRHSWNSWVVSGVVALLAVGAYLAWRLWAPGKLGISTRPNLSSA